MPRVWTQRLLSGLILSTAVGLSGCGDGAETPPTLNVNGTQTTSSKAPGAATQQSQKPVQTADATGAETGEPALEDPELVAIQAVLDEAFELYDTDPVQAMAKIEAGIKKYPDSPDLWITKAEWLHYEGDDALQIDDLQGAEQAYKLATAAVVGFPKDIPPTDEDLMIFQEIFYNQAIVLSQLNKGPAAIASIKQAIAFGYQDDVFLANDELLANITSTPEIQTIVGEMKKSKIDAVMAAMDEFETMPFTMEAKDVNGRPLSLQAMRGKVVIVDVWATWCIPCRNEIPHFIELLEKNRLRGLAVVGLNYENEDGPDHAETIENVRKFALDQNIPYPCGLITDEIRDQIPNFQSLPTTLFVGRDGNVRLILVGAHPDYVLESVTNRLLAEK